MHGLSLASALRRTITTQCAKTQSRKCYNLSAQAPKTLRQKQPGTAYVPFRFQGLCFVTHSLSSALCGHWLWQQHYYVSTTTSLILVGTMRCQKLAAFAS